VRLWPGGCDISKAYDAVGISYARQYALKCDKITVDV